MSNKCFIIMPISTPPDCIEAYGGDEDHFAHVLDCLFVPAVKSCGLDPVPPTSAGTDVIHADIIRNLASGDLVLCDMSQLNPNVFFELGIRTALDRPAALVVDDKTTAVPFDTGIVNYHRYESSLSGWVLEEQKGLLAAHLKQTLDGDTDRNAVWKYFSVAESAHFGTDRTTPDDKMNLVLRRLEAMAETRQLPSSLFRERDARPLLSYTDAQHRWQAEYLRRILTEAGGSKTGAAELAQVSLATLYRLLQKYDIDSTGFREPVPGPDDSDT